MCQSNYLEFSRDALLRNAVAVCETVDVPVIGIVKCNGYGVTIREAAAAWQAAGVTTFGVSRPEEAMALRKMGFYEDILLLSPVNDVQTLTEMLAHHIILTISSFENACFYSTNVSEYPVRVHIAVDTGMGRFGIRWNDVAQIQSIYSLSGLSFEGIFSHFSCAFEREYRETKRQLARFLSVTNILQATGSPIGVRHIANSCAALRFADTCLDAVRIGSALVGRLPVSVPIHLERIGGFKAQVVDRKHLQRGDTVGYGGIYKVKKNTDAVVVALGRADGFGIIPKPDKLCLKDLASYLYHLLKAWVLPPCVVCNGYRLPVLGRIGNQHTLFDATNTTVKAGDMVEWDGPLLHNTCEKRIL